MSKKLTHLTMGISALGLFLGVQGFTLKAPSFTTKIAPEVAKILRTEKNVRLPILVTLKTQADLSNADALESRDAKVKFVYETLSKVARDSQKDLVQFLKLRNAEFQQFYITNMVAVSGASPELVKELAQRTDVAWISGNIPYKINLFPLGTFSQFRTRSLSQSLGIEKSIEATHAPRVWNELKVTGAGITVAGQDTGVEWDHPALLKHYRGYSQLGVDHNYSWHDAIQKPLKTEVENRCGYNLSTPCDDSDHGTHTLGTVVGDDDMGNQIGMAPGAQWMACRNMDGGTGQPATYIDCFQYFLAPYPQGGDPMKDGDPSRAPHIINNSWGCPSSEGCSGREFIPVLQAMVKAGIMVVVSAGNDGPQCETINTQPAQVSDLVLSVGAYDVSDGTIANFSSRGPSALDGHLSPDVTAPGVGVTSAVPGKGFAGGYMWSGTSMAGPHVAGEVALLWSAKPSLIGKISQTIDIIHKATTPKISDENCDTTPGSQIPNNTYGFGEIDAYRAVSSQL